MELSFCFNFKTVFSILLLSRFVAFFANGFSCLDEDGQPVDSWNAIKGHENVSYWYYNDVTESFDLSPYTVNQTTNGAIMRTVNQMYSYPDDMEFVAYGTYNDDPPPPFGTASSTYAHSKGLLLTDENKGFWLVHSMPNWPNARPEGPAPFPDFTYGQSLMCVTIKMETSDMLANNFMINRPYIYSSNITTAAAATLPSFDLWLDHKYSKVDTNVSSFTSYGGVEFFQFAKSKYWAEDLWDDLVAPTFQTELNVETWRSGSGGRMSSWCGANASAIVEYDIYEVSGMLMNNGVSWTGTQDHSKWAAARYNLTTSSGDTTLQQANTAACVGDINRMCSQEKRGGGALCIHDLSLWTAFNKTISGFESCFEYYPCGGGGSQCYWCPTEAPTTEPSGPSYGPTVKPSHKPSSDPTGIPTIAPSAVPTTVPTPLPGDPTATPTTATPTANPTATPVPTNVPTYHPTNVPTAYPTTEEDVLENTQMLVVQTISNTTYDIYMLQEDANALTIQQTVAASIGYDLNSSNVDILDVTSSGDSGDGFDSSSSSVTSMSTTASVIDSIGVKSTRKRTLADSNTGIFITYTVAAVTNYFDSEQEAYDVLAASLSLSVADYNFSEYMHGYAQFNDAHALMNAAAIILPNITDESASPSSSGDDKLTAAMTALIVVGAIVFAVAAGLLYMFNTKKSKSRQNSSETFTSRGGDTVSALSASKIRDAINSNDSSSDGTMKKSSSWSGFRSKDLPTDQIELSKSFEDDMI